IRRNVMLKHNLNQRLGRGSTCSGISNILYFEGLKDYVKLYIEGTSKLIVFYSTMKSLEEKLPLDRFMRVHRSFIVSLNKIKTIERNRIIFGDKRIPISKQYKSGFDEFVKKKFLL
uniref:LytR/AlgR family response regulator transcription factor n=1 Tax=Saccharicrinis sp. 156 TaxID=3417574 RepID=UPI003D33FAD1